MYPVSHHPYGREPSSSSPYDHEPYRSASYDSCQEEIQILVRGQAELKQLVKDLVGRVEKLKEKLDEMLDEKSENTSSSHKLPPELSVCSLKFNIWVFCFHPFYKLVGMSLALVLFFL